MPTCQHTMSVTVSGPFTIGPTVSPSATSSHQRGSAPAGPRRRTGPRSRRSARRCRASSSTSSYFLRSRAFVRSVRIISRYWADSSGPSSSRNTWPVHSWTARSANSLGLSSTPTRALRRVTCRPGRSGAHHSRALAAVEGVDAAERVALHEVPVLGGDLGDLVLADQRVAADQRRRGDRAAPSGWRRRRPGSDHSGLSSP